MMKRAAPVDLDRGDCFGFWALEFRYPNLRGLSGRGGHIIKLGPNLKSGRRWVAGRQRVVPPTPGTQPIDRVG